MLLRPVGRRNFSLLVVTLVLLLSLSGGFVRAQSGVDPLEWIPEHLESTGPGKEFP
jgi:hypothetical protein